VLLWCGLLARDGLALRADWETLQSDLAAWSGSRIELPLVQTHVASMRANLVALRSHAGPLLAVAPALGWLPRIGGDVQSAPALLDMAIELLAGGDRALTALAPLWPPRAGEGRSAVEQIARGLDAARPDLEAFQSHVDRAGEIRQRIDPAILSGATRSLLDRFDATYPTLRAGAELVSVAPQLLGVDRPRTYLILIQNEDELRPTGGFITAVGRVTLDAGRIVTLTVADVYQVDDFGKPYGDPPAPLRDYMGLELWVFRDSNWSPDFPTSARTAIELYTYAQGGAIDGVVGLNQKVVQALVAGLGPIPIDSDQPPLTADNIRAYMQSAWAPSGQVDPLAWLAQRKEFIGNLAQAVLDRAMNGGDQIDWLAVGRAIFGVLRSRDLLIYLNDDVATRPLARAGWDGALRPTEGDFLMVVDANLGFNKVNALMQQSLAYTATLGADGSNTADVTLTYTHTGATEEGCVHAVPNYGLDTTYEGLIQQCYWNYRRVLAPAGARLIDATRHPVGSDHLITQQATDGSTRVSVEKGKTVFGTLLIVGRGQRLETRLRYALPKDIVKTDNDQRVYHLLIQKQPGAGAWPLTVTVVWPSGWQLVTAHPAPISVADTAAVFQSALDADYEVSVVVGPPH